MKLIRLHTSICRSRKAAKQTEPVKKERKKPQHNTTNALSARIRNDNGVT